MTCLGEISAGRSGQLIVARPGFRPVLAIPRQASSALNVLAARHLGHALMLALMLGVVAAGSYTANSRTQTSQSALPQASSAAALTPGAIVVPVIASTEPGAWMDDRLTRFAALSLPGVSLPPTAPASQPPAATPQAEKPAPELKSYTVTNGDNPYTLAGDFGISEETLLAANGLNADSLLSIGQKLLVPPVNGIVVTTQPGASVSHLASQWKIDPGTLASVNKLPAGADALTADEALVLPGVTPPVQLYPADNGQADVKASLGDTNPRAIVKSAQSQAAAPAVDKRPAVYRAGPNKFPYGQCTWWAAQQRPDIGGAVIGNAASWLYAARAAGLATGSVPRVGAIVVYQPGVQGSAGVGHVAYVTSVSGNHFTISEMNYAGWGIVSRRSSYAGWGVGFIY